MRELSFNEVQHVSGAELILWGVCIAAFSAPTVIGYGIISGFNNFDLTKTMYTSALVGGMAGGILGAIAAQTLVGGILTYAIGIGFCSASGAFWDAYLGAGAYKIGYTIGSIAAGN